MINEVPKILLSRVGAWGKKLVNYDASKRMRVEGKIYQRSRKKKRFEIFLEFQILSRLGLSLEDSMIKSHK